MLRTQVRTLSQRVQQIRGRVLEKVESAASKNKLPADAPIELQEIAAEESKDFKESLEELSQLLNHSKWTQLPKQMKSLQDTIEVIQKESERPLSQTDIAIISRNNSSEEEGLALSSHEDQDLSAPDRLLQFFHDI